MKRLVAFIVLLAAAGGGIWYYYKYGKVPEKPQVIQTKISRGDVIETVSATGTLEPLRRVDVGSQVSGVVQDIFVDFNTIVKKGQVLAQIDPTLLQVQVDIRTAAIERQTMDIANQEIQLEDVKRQLERTKNLFEKGLQNQQQLEAAELSVKLRQAQIDSAKKQLVQAQADLQQAKLNVEYTTIKSPIDGVVVERRVDRGQTVQSSMTTPQFFVLATDLRTLKLTAGVDEADIGKIRPDMDVDFIVEAYGQTRFRGTVDSVRLNAQTANNVVTYPVWITVENPDLRLRPSMTAQVKVIISTASDVVRVPNNAFRFRPNADMYLALGLQAPQAGQGRRLGGPGDPNGDPAAGNGQPRQGGQGAAAQGGAAGQGGKQVEAGPGGGQGQGGQGQGGQGQGGQGQGGKGGGNRERMQGGGGNQSGQPGQPGNRQPGGGGFGRQSGMGNLTPEQIQAMRERFAQQGGRGGGRGGPGGAGQSQGAGQPGGGRGGQGGGRGGRNQEPANTGAPLTPLDADKIDELFKELPRQVSPQQVWTWDEAKKELKQINIRVGVTDGTFSEVVSGDVQVGQDIVTNIIIPQTRATTTGQNPFMQQPGRGGPGGFGPGGPGGGGPGGGGGRGGGGGGGGRGGGD